MARSLLYTCGLNHMVGIVVIQESIGSTFIVQNALLASRLSKRVGNRLSVHGVSLTEYLVMRYLDGAPHHAVPRIELADHLGMSASGVTRLIAPMEKNRVIERATNPRDARQRLVRLTETGQRIYGEASVSFEHIASELVGGLSLGQQEQMVALYAKVTSG